jgi:hypothetical protein
MPPDEQLERASIIIGNDAPDEQGIAVGHGQGVAALICRRMIAALMKEPMPRNKNTKPHAAERNSPELA